MIARPRVLRKCLAPRCKPGKVSLPCHMDELASAHQGLQRGAHRAVDRCRAATASNHNEHGSIPQTQLRPPIGLAQLERIEEHVKKKIWIGKTYNTLLAPLQGKGLLQLPAEKNWAKNTYWMYGVVLNRDADLDANTVIKRLAESGVQTRPFFYPLHKQPAFQRFDWFKKETLPVSENLYKYGFYLPSGLTLDEKKIETVTNVLAEIL